MPLEQVSRHVVVTTDASKTGCGAVCNGHAASGSWTGPQLQCAACSSPVSTIAAGQACTCPDGQHGNSGVYQSPGRLMSQLVPPSPPLESDVAQIAAYRSCFGRAQSCSRCTFTTAYPSWRMETPSSGGSAHLESIRGSPGGPVRFPNVLLLFYSLTEAPLGTDALAHSWPWGLCKYAFPPSEPPCTDPVQDQGGRGAGPVGCAVLAHLDLVCQPHASCDSPSLEDSPEEGPSKTKEGD